MALNNIMISGLAAFAFAASAMLASSSAEAQRFRGDSIYTGEGFDGRYVFGGIGIGRTAFPIPGAIPAGTPYDPYRLPYTFDWPYGYGYVAR